MFLRIRNRMDVMHAKKFAMLMMAVVLMAMQFGWPTGNVSAAPPTEIGVSPRSIPNQIKDTDLKSGAYNEGAVFSNSGSYLFATEGGALWRYYNGSSWKQSTAGGTTDFVEVRSGSSEGSPFFALKSNSEIWKWDINSTENVEQKLTTVKEEGFNAVSGYYFLSGSNLFYFVTGIYDDPGDETPLKAVVFSNLPSTLPKTELAEASSFSPKKMEFIDNKLVVIGKGSHAYVYDPANGATWNKIDLPDSDANYVDIAGPAPGPASGPFAGKFVAVADDTNNIYYANSAAGPWSKVVSPSGYKMKSVAYGYGYYIAVGEGGAMFSKDGVNWSVFATGTDKDLNHIEYTSYGEFLAVGKSGTRIEMQAPIGGFSASSYTLDKKTPADIEGEVTLTYNMDFTDFTGIMNGSTPLVEDVDYTVVFDEEDDRVFVTLKKEYLSEQPIGALILDFQFSKGYPCPVEITIKDTSAPPLTPTTANAANNSVNASPSTVSVGGSVTLTATGDRQSATGAVVGDEKFVPINWVSTEVGKAGSFTLTDGIYTSAYTPSASGSYNVTVSYQKQTWNGSIWTTSVAGDSKSTTVTVNAASTATTANAANNSVGASQSSITAGGTVTLTAAGDRQSVTGAVYGDERYVPVSWSSTETGKTGSFALNAGNYTSAYTPSAEGSHTVTATFRKQVWNGVEWTNTEMTGTKTITLTVNAAGGGSGSGGSGGGSGGSSGGTTTTPSDETVIVLVNGKSENAGTATKGKRNNQSMVTIHVDEKKLNDKLASEGQGAVVTIPVGGGSDIVVGELNGQMIKNMENKQAVLEIKTDTATYAIPAQQINIDAISAQVGKSVALQDITVRIEIAATPAGMANVVENAAAKGTFSIVVPPLDFTVSAVYGDKTVDVSKFNIYVERTIAIPDGVDPNKITTGVVVDSDGTVRHVPTKIVVIDGKYYAKVNSLTNSTYSIVWHPLEFSDVAKHWAKDAVNDMGSRMVIDGTGNGLFGPNRNITRAEFAAIVVRGLGLKLEEGTASFSDVNATDWYASAVSTAYAYGLIDGYQDGTFRPTEKITREQAMTILSKAMEVTGLKAKLASQSADATLRSFDDAASVSAWAQSGVADSVQAGIVSGRNADTLAPKDFITRAEVAATIQRLLQKSGLI